VSRILDVLPVTEPDRWLPYDGRSRSWVSNGTTPVRRWTGGSLRFQMRSSNTNSRCRSSTRGEEGYLTQNRAPVGPHRPIRAPYSPC